MLDRRYTPEIQWCRGRDFSYSGRWPFSHLAYPISETNTEGFGGRGGGAALDLGGQVRFGPDVAYSDSIDYQIEERVKGDFAQAIQRYFPGLVDIARISHGYCGIRPKLSGPGGACRRFSGPGAGNTLSARSG